MYSLVLMMALSNGSADASIEPGVRPGVSYANHGHTLDRGRRCNGCNGCNGCSGRRGGRGCHGCYGCCGCWGGGGCYGGGCHGYSGGGGCHGGGGHGYGAYGSYGYGAYEYGSYFPNMIASAAAEAPARIVVNLPANAKLTVDDQATTSQSDQRTLISPSLKPGEEYHYTLKAEIQRDGKPMSETKRVVVQAGREVNVRFDFDKERENLPQTQQ